MIAEKPKVELLKKGETFKILQVTGEEGMTMPAHHSTKEAVIMVQHGSAILSLGGKDITLNQEDIFFIPAGEVHTLQLKDSFKAALIMGFDTNIAFKQG